MKQVMKMIVGATIVAAATPAMAGEPKPPHLYGPQPSWDAYRRIAEAAIVARLIDPGSAQITWITGIYKGELKPFLSARVAGYWACGTVNAKNRFGGYTGAHTFVIAIDYDRVLSTNVDTRTGGLFDEGCAKLIGNGTFPPVPAEPSGTEPEPQPPSLSNAVPLANAVTGLALRAMPDGAYVAAVVPGSPAAVAGLKPGMVVASVNAIPLSGMGDAMLKVVDAAGGNAMLTLVGGRSIKLSSRP